MSISAEAFLQEQLRSPEASFSIGVSGAIAEFIRAGGKAEVRHRGATHTVTTAGGAMRVALMPSVVPVAVKTPGRTHAARHQQVAFCLLGEAAAMGGRQKLTELGPDADAIDPAGRGQVRFDLGLSLPHIDACVRTDDPDLIDLLRRYCGKALLGEAREVCEAIVARSPPRVFCSRLGRIEVTSPIPKDRSPMGPHTHLLPHLLGRPAAIDAYLPPGHVSCLDVYPADPETISTLTLSNPGP